MMANLKKRKLHYSSHDQFAKFEGAYFIADISNSCKRRRCDKTNPQLPLHSSAEFQTADKVGTFCIGKSVPLQRKRSLREKLTRRVSRYLMKSKLKRLEDYSLNSFKKEDSFTLSEQCSMMSDHHFVHHFETFSNSADDIIHSDTGPEGALTNFSSHNLRGTVPSLARERTNSINDSVSKDNSHYLLKKTELLKPKAITHATRNQSDIITVLQQIINSECQFREESLTSMFTSSNSEQALDAVKRFHVSNARVAACTEKLKNQQAFNNFNNDDELTPCNAKICLSDIRIPLIWKDADYFSNKGDYRRYAVFCLVKLGHQVESTLIQKNIDRTMTDLTFNDVFVFNDVDHDFEVSLEIYCHKLHEDLSIASTPVRLKKRLTGMSESFTRHLGKAISGLSSADITKNMILGPKFELVAKGTLLLPDADVSIATHDLLMTNSRTTSHDLPLFGCYCCRLAVQPYCLMEPALSGSFLLEGDEEEGHEEEHVWCELKNGNIDCKRLTEASSHSISLPTIPVNRNTKIERKYEDQSGHAGNVTCLRKLIISNDKVYTLASSSESLLTQWWNGLQKYWLNRIYWKQACNQCMEILPTLTEEDAECGPKVPTYDEISINEL